MRCARRLRQVPLELVRTRKNLQRNDAEHVRGAGYAELESCGNHDAVARFCQILLIQKMGYESNDFIGRLPRIGKKRIDAAHERESLDRLRVWRERDNRT